MEFGYVSGGPRRARLATIDGDVGGLMRKVYCRCGRIVDVDRCYMSRRLSLHKELECPECRNARISKEIDELNAHFSPEQQEDGLCW